MIEVKILVAYFSRPGNNYVGGKIVNLSVGNTEVAAKMIHDITKGDLFRIESVKAYPEDYTETTEVAKQELRSNARPNLVNHLKNMASYDLIFLGYPNWWGTVPMPVATFLEEYDFSGKTIVPFCTHEGSGLGHSVTDIKKVCSKSTVMEGLAVRGGSVRNAKDEIAVWLSRTGMNK
ncbi:MAG TPA: flavodoxin [Methanocella sp.]|uniref:flavodoxin n=1 Tax=Methanocella sp. TaxID=2052833 RepID=UPI002B640160|nr:flavodoxin [Methanocella sp.]HTY89751.1 flavodoxin [Methanocella sp.]